MASNRITDPATAEKILTDDMPIWSTLAECCCNSGVASKAFEGRADEIRPCVACSEGCTDQVFIGQPVFCIGNPRASY